MIIDGHAYCFPPLGEASGFPTAREHLRYLQREMADHHQPVWRLRDRAPGDNATLADPADRTLEGRAGGVGFRAGGHGRFVWTENGAEYAKQYLPPYLTDLSHPPEMLVAQMDYVGVDRAVLHANPDHGHAERVPGRLRPPVPGSAARAGVRGRVGDREGSRGARRRGGPRLRGGPRRVPVHHERPVPPRCHRLVGRTRVPRVLGRRRGPRAADLLHPERVAASRRWRTTWDSSGPGDGGWSATPAPRRCTRTAFRGGCSGRDDGCACLPRSFEPFQGSTAKLQLLFQISLGNVWDYPYPELATAVAQLVDTLGSDRLMWGTDMPNVERFCNYRQTLDTFRVHCRGLIGDADIANIVGGTTARLFGLDGGLLRTTAHGTRSARARGPGRRLEPRHRAGDGRAARSPKGRASRSVRAEARALRDDRRGDPRWHGGRRAGPRGRRPERRGRDAADRRGRWTGTVGWTSWSPTPEARRTPVRGAPAGDVGRRAITWFCGARSCSAARRSRT